MTDRKTRFALTAGGICLAIGLLLIVPGIYFALSERHEAARLREAGHTVDADAVTRLGTAGRHYTRIAYRFTTSGGQQISSDRADIPNEDWQAVQDGRRLRVTYARDDPRVHRIAEQKLVGWAFVVWLILGAIPAALGAILIHIGIRRRR